MNREIRYNAWDEELGITVFVSTMAPADMRRGTGIYKQAGYVMRRVVGHPRANNRGYVLEHRLVVESYIKRLLRHDEIVHHKNGIKDDNSIENLEILTDQKRHAKGHAASLARDEQSGKWTPDPVLGSKKYRLLNRNTGIMEIRDLSNLINTTFRKSQFEYRGTFTGLKDKNGKEIYEGDILNFDPALYGDNMPQSCVVEWSHYRAGWKVVGGIQFVALWAMVAGNIYENPELLEK